MNFNPQNDYDRGDLFNIIASKLGRDISNTPALRRWMHSNGIATPARLGTIKELYRFILALEDDSLETLYGVYVPPQSPPKCSLEERRDKMLAMKNDGESFTTIAATFGISRQRVHQILKMGKT